MVEKISISKHINIVFETPSSEFTEWFGYYNYDTLNADKSKILCNRASFEGCVIEKGMTIELGYYDLETQMWHHIGETDSFNWQQGAMLQWLPGKGNENKVIYNFSDGTHFKSCIHDIATGEDRIIDFPVYCVLPDGKRALALNYERSYWCRAYHYQSIQNPDYDVKIAKDDGVFLVDLENNSKKLLLPLEVILQHSPDASFNNASHWLEHIMISPDASRFVVLHRYSQGNVYSYLTRICIASIDGTGLQVISDWKQYGWSHFGWKKSDSFAIFTYQTPVISAPSSALSSSESKTRVKQFIYNVSKYIAKTLIPSKMLKRLAGKAEYYQVYEMIDGKFELMSRIEGYPLDIDGHPSFTNDGKYMITDTYPAKNNYQRLIVYNCSTGMSLVLGVFYAALKGNPASCDLHPKLSRDNSMVSIDTAHTGRHKLMAFKINWDEIKKEIG